MRDPVRIVTLLTDFGTRDSYVAQMKGVLLSRCSNCLPVDITHEVPPQNVLSGALALQESCFRFPPGTVHLAVVDPGVGTDRKILAVSYRGHYFVLPDNGLISLAVPSFHEADVFEVANINLFEAAQSETFHGRDIMAPIAAYLASGGVISGVGPQAQGFVQVKIPAAELLEDCMIAHVIQCDHFGNLITNVPYTQLMDWLWGRGAILDESDASLGLDIRGKSMVVPAVRTYGIGSNGGMVALAGSQGWLEFSRVNGSAAEFLGVKVGESLRIRREFLGKDER